jgi:hypothetical protein
MSRSRGPHPFAGGADVARSDRNVVVCPELAVVANVRSLLVAVLPAASVERTR